MFVGHYAAAFAAKAAEPRAPLWTYVGACQLMDIGWSGLVAAGVEKFRVDPSLPGSGLDLYFMPYTHSLPGSLALSAAALLAALVFRMPWRAALFIGLTVFSHWLLDLLVHRPDLLLWFGGPKVGLGFWNDPIPEMALEIGLVAVFGAAWVAQRKDQSLKAWPAIAFIAGLVALQIYASMPGGGTTGGTDAATTTAMALAAYLVVTGLAWLVERGQAAALKRAAILSAG
jgi:hypothetical protein